MSSIGSREDAAALDAIEPARVEPLAGVDVLTVAEGAPQRRSGLRAFFAGVVRTGAGPAGLILLALVVLIAVVGPLVRPHDPAEVIGMPFAAPGGDALLGTDFLGRDVLSRFLSGGLLLLMLSLGATIAAYVIGGVVGLLAGYRRGRLVDYAAVGVTDVFISIPPIVLALLMVTGLGSGALVVGAAIALVQIPPVIRLVRAFTMSTTGAEYVEAAIARGERTSAILVREILPNLRALVLADLGIRVSWSIILIASLSFLGFGQAPPAADWGLMVGENRFGLTTQPLAVVAPAAAIAALTIGLNLTADAFARAIGRTSGSTR